MSDWFQTIADVEAGPGEAPELAAALLDWLVFAGVVDAGVTDCALGPGHPPGPDWTGAVAEPDPWIPGLTTNGMRVLTGRNVFNSDLAEHARCPHCHAVYDLAAGGRAWPWMSAAIDEWYAGGDGLLACPACGRHLGLNDWVWSPPWAFGHLGLTFWNWPPLDPAFVAEVGRRLGHRVVVPAGKL